MQTFVMVGKYTPESLRVISADRTNQVVDAISVLGGEVKEMYALLGGNDLLFIVELPSTEDAIKASVALSKMTGISFTTSPAVDVDRFDKLVNEVERFQV